MCFFTFRWLHLVSSWHKTNQPTLYLPVQFRVLYLSLFKKKKKSNQNLQSDLYWPTTPEHGVYHRVWLIHPRILHWREHIFLLQEAIVCKSLPGRDGTLCLIPRLHDGILSGVSLCRFWACCHSFYEFVPVSALLSLENAVFLKDLLTLQLWLTSHLVEWAFNLLLKTWLVIPFTLCHDCIHGHSLQVGHYYNSLSWGNVMMTSLLQ